MQSWCAANCFYNDSKENIVAVRINLVHLEHNHEFIKKDTKKMHLQCNKTHDPEYMEFLSAMQQKQNPRNTVSWTSCLKCMVVLKMYQLQQRTLLICKLHFIYEFRP